MQLVKISLMNVEVRLDAIIRKRVCIKLAHNVDYELMVNTISFDLIHRQVWSTIRDRINEIIKK